ncbi:sigma-70 family RNA polymerase sigma factor [Skermania sp. ID1734]|uniref:sigma-70 family RNA polymerase sigma factor n=1 Tax=Skermania sp. ID1734 TaxID=2597516 RepID=UPI00117EE68C|nr:sigma-70 family RNA polymerase sigma factor [Skermania sp. ID1734]TSD94901.1 sigma-70 family RNA polymerase sigma factor [Skermania sp. ID1734]
MTESTTLATTPAIEATSLDELWRDFSRDLRAFIVRRVATPEDADDILQIVFLRMAKGLDELRDRDRILGWMFSITRNAITDYYRAAPHRRELAVDTVPDHVADSPDGADAAQRELSACLQPMLATLPDEQADAVRMVDLEAQTHVTAAASAGISVSGMKSRVQRGRAALRRQLAACCHIDQDTRGHVHDYQPRNDSCACTGTN